MLKAKKLFNPHAQLHVLHPESITRACSTLKDKFQEQVLVTNTVLWFSGSGLIILFVQQNVLVRMQQSLCQGQEIVWI